MLLAKSAVTKHEGCKRLKLGYFSTMLLPAQLHQETCSPLLEQGPWTNLCEETWRQPHFFPLKTCRTWPHGPAKAFLVLPQETLASRKGQVSLLSILCPVDLPALSRFSFTTAVLLPAHFSSRISCTAGTV